MGEIDTRNVAGHTANMAWAEEAVAIAAIAFSRADDWCLEWFQNIIL